jgi:lanosterol synthase
MWRSCTRGQGNCTQTAAVRRGAKFILWRQEKNGDWPEEDIKGVFNKSCMISYSNYKNIFPIWALGRFREHFGSQSLDAINA